MNEPTAPELAKRAESRPSASPIPPPISENSALFETGFPWAISTAVVAAPISAPAIAVRVTPTISSQRERLRARAAYS